MQDRQKAEQLIRSLRYASKFLEPVRLDGLYTDPGIRYQLPSGFALADLILGQGSYGKVYRAIDTRRRQKVAVKEINQERLGSEERKLMQQEIELCQVLSEDSHPSIVGLLDVYEDN
jgi:hypothetical protein